jgi:hypothetical protein
VIFAESRRVFGCASIVLLAAACASSRAPENPDVKACLPPATKVLYSRDYDTRLAAHRARADAFAQCMQDRGYTFDQDALDQRVLHFEQVKNADLYGGDPLRASRVYEQEQRLSAELWRSGS